MTGRLHNTDESSGVAIATGATALLLPPTEFGLVASWSRNDIGVVPEFDLSIWSVGAVDLTFATLYGAVLHSFVYVDTVITSASAAANTITKAGHGLHTGDGPLTLTSTLTVPGGTSGIEVWAIEIDVNTIKVATTLLNAMAGTFIDLTTDGTGVITLHDTATTQRVHWEDLGLLGKAGDGAISLTDQVAYRTRRNHRPQVIAYGISATLSGAVATSVAVYPIEDAG